MVVEFLWGLKAVGVAGWIKLCYPCIYAFLPSKFGVSSICCSNMYAAIKGTSLELNEVTVSVVAMFNKNIFTLIYRPVM